MSFLLIFPEYESSQGPDKKRTVYQMALSKKSLSLLLWYCKKVFRYVKGTVHSFLRLFGMWLWLPANWYSCIINCSYRQSPSCIQWLRNTVALSNYIWPFNICSCILLSSFFVLSFSTSCTTGLSSLISNLIIWIEVTWKCAWTCLSIPSSVAVTCCHQIRYVNLPSQGCWQWASYTTAALLTLCQLMLGWSVLKNI